jgi:FkbM family methyltransferase
MATIITTQVARAYRAMPAPVRRPIDRLRGLVYRRYPRRVRSGVGAGLRIYDDRATNYASGLNERPVQDALARLLRPGDTFYDIGANIGFFSMLGARLVGPDGRVHAFEPVAANVAAVERNLALNGIKNVTIHRQAAARTSGFAELILSRHSGGAALCLGQLVPGDAVGIVQVETVCIDEGVASGRLPPPNVVKLDVEGAEHEVIEGMRQTLTLHRPALVYELDDEDTESFRRRRALLDELVEEIGYSILHLEPSYAGSPTLVGHAVALPVQR